MQSSRREISKARGPISGARSRSQGPDGVLRARVYFNLGLVAEASGDDDAAWAAFKSSDELHPSEAAAKKAASGREVSLCGRGGEDPALRTARIRSTKEGLVLRGRSCDKTVPSTVR